MIRQENCSTYCNYLPPSSIEGDSFESLDNTEKRPEKAAKAAAADLHVLLTVQ